MARTRRKNRIETHYQILGVSHDASPKEIKSAWRKLAEKYHPDKTRDRPEHIRKRFNKRMKLVNQAKDVLMNNTARSFYDYRLGYRDFAEVVEEEIEEVEPIGSVNDMNQGVRPSPEAGVPGSDQDPGTDEGKGDDTEEAEIFAEAIEYFEIDGSEVFSLSLNDDGTTASEYQGADVLSEPDASVREVSGKAGESAPQKIEKKDHGEAPGEFHPQVREGQIPFWDQGKPDGGGGPREFIKIEENLFEENMREVSSKRIFDGGKAYHMEVRPVSFYKDDNVIIEVTSSGFKHGDIRQKRKRKE